MRNSSTSICLAPLICAGLCASVSSVWSTPISVTKVQTTIETAAPTGGPYNSSFFSSDYTGSIIFGSQTGFASSTQAGTASSLSSAGTISIVGNSTSAGGWVDGNGVPAGITLSFNASFTVSTPTANSYLTLGTTLGNGIGVSQTTGTSGAINTTELLDISSLTISLVSFSGTLTESGYALSAGAVNNAGWSRIRSNNFGEATAGAVVTDSLLSTWGFGLATGSAGSGLLINNNYTDNNINPVGGIQISTTTGTGWNIKGLGFNYDVAYDISPVPEPSTFTLALLGGLSLFLTRRKNG